MSSLNARPSAPSESQRDQERGPNVRKASPNWRATDSRSRTLQSGDRQSRPCNDEGIGRQGASVGLHLELAGFRISAHCASREYRDSRLLRHSLSSMAMISWACRHRKAVRAFFVKSDPMPADQLNEIGPGVAGQRRLRKVWRLLDRNGPARVPIGEIASSTPRNPNFLLRHRCVRASRPCARAFRPRSRTSSRPAPPPMIMTSYFKASDHNRCIALNKICSTATDV